MDQTNHLRERLLIMANYNVEPHPVLDMAREALRVKTDSQLAQLLGKEKALVSRVRNRKREMPAHMILAIHEATEIPIAEIRRQLGHFQHQK